MSGIKLTKPQRELLDSLPTTCADSFPPARRLVELGLARWEPRKFSDWLVRTEKKAPR